MSFMSKERYKRKMQEGCRVLRFQIPSIRVQLMGLS